MDTGKYNFLITITYQLLSFKKDIVYLLACDLTSDIRNDTVGAENIASIFNLEKCPCVTIKLTDLQVEGGFVTAKLLVRGSLILLGTGMELLSETKPFFTNSIILLSLPFSKT